MNKELDRTCIIGRKWFIFTLLCFTHSTVLWARGRLNFISTSHNFGSVDLFIIIVAHDERWLGIAYFSSPQSGREILIFNVEENEAKMINLSEIQDDRPISNLVIERGKILMLHSENVLSVCDAETGNLLKKIHFDQEILGSLKVSQFDFKSAIF